MDVNGARLIADTSGAVFYPAEKTLLVADLHFEKGSSFAARRGALLPPYDTAATLAALEGCIARWQPALVVCLGDSFHDAGAPGRLSADECRWLERLAGGRRWIWICGNHDPAPPALAGGEAMRALSLGRLHLRHEPRPVGASDAVAGEIAGHLHPKATVRVRGRRLVRRCFVGDGSRLVLPSFGAYTGGLDVLDPAFQPLFPGEFQAWMIGRRQLFRVPSRRLARAG